MFFPFWIHVSISECHNLCRVYTKCYRRNFSRLSFCGNLTSPLTSFRKCRLMVVVNDLLANTQERTPSAPSPQPSPTFAPQQPPTPTNMPPSTAVYNITRQSSRHTNDSPRFSNDASRFSKYMFAMKLYYSFHSSLWRDVITVEPTLLGNLTTLVFLLTQRGLSISSNLMILPLRMLIISMCLVYVIEILHWYANKSQLITRPVCGYTTSISGWGQYAR